MYENLCLGCCKPWSFYSCWKRHRERRERLLWGQKASFKHGSICRDFHDCWDYHSVGQQILKRDRKLWSLIGREIWKNEIRIGNKQNNPSCLFSWKLDIVLVCLCCMLIVMVIMVMVVLCFMFLVAKHFESKMHVKLLLDLRFLPWWFMGILSILSMIITNMKGWFLSLVSCYASILFVLTLYASIIHCTI